MSEKPTLYGRRLAKSFGSGERRTAALREVSLELFGGEVSLLMGPSGGGKTTLLAVLSGLLRPDGGEVQAMDLNLWKASEQERERFRLRRCGFIFQGSHLFPALTARQQLEMVLCWGEGLSIGEAKPRVAEMLSLLGLEKRKDALPEELSGGEKQRVAVGRALIKKPTFCFADEPTSALDWERGKQVIELLSMVAHQWGSTVLIVAHDPRIIEFSDRVFHLTDGRIADPLLTAD